MQKRTLKVAILAVLAIVLVLGMSTAALADQTWPDLPDTVTAKYGITDNQVAGISEGFSDGLWKPYQAVTRAQFTKMAVAAFNIPLADPAVASFVDVPKGSAYYPYVEGAKAAGIVNGTSATTFGAKDNITRQQAIAIVARYVAEANGYDLATMYSAEEIDALLAHFGDAASISADLKDEVAFAFDMGLTQGNDYGNVSPLANMTRIQGAAFLIRAQALVPPEKWTAAKIELVSADKTEGLIGQIYSATFAVTTAAGHPAKNVLVDFDSLGGAEFYVGNVTQQAMMTNSYGQVTVDLISLEPGTQRVSASVSGVGTIYTTRYWLALDEVYNVKGCSAQNNVGVEHEWGVRVIVFGPGPRSTSQNDWYNFIDADFDPTDIDELDGVDGICDYGLGDVTYGDELYMANPALNGDAAFTPRTMAGIDVEWAIYDEVDDPTTYDNEAVTSVGNIIAVDGVAITPAKTAVGKTDAAGYSSIKVYSEVTGVTLTEAVADYAENPYPEELFHHRTFQDSQRHDVDWEDQPKSDSLQVKTWIPHTIGGEAGPISAAYDTANIGEELTLTITLADEYGNPAAGKYVEWFMQGVGFFQTDDAGDSSDPDTAANNKDFDVTDAAGKATLFVKSYDAGEQIVHAKVRDKGTGGAEGSYLTYTAEVQWFDADIATFDDITTTRVLIPESTGVPEHMDYQDEAVSSNAVNGTHEFCLHVYGLKLEYVPSIDFADAQTPLIDSDAAGSSYDGIIDAKDATYFGGLLMWPMPARDFTADWAWWEDKLKPIWGYDMRIAWGDGYDYNPMWTGPGDALPAMWLAALPFDDDFDGIIDADEGGTIEFKVGGVWLQLSFVGAYTMYDYDDDGFKEPFGGVPGIYLPLEGKTVTFAVANEYMSGYSNMNASAGYPLLGVVDDFAGADTTAVGKIDSPTAAVVTDAAGKACVTVSSTAKGPQTIKAIVDWAGNPHNGPELLTAFAKKQWVSGTVGAAGDVTIEVLIDGVKVADNKVGEIKEAVNPMWTWVWDPEVGESGAWVKALNSANVEVHVKDAYGNDLADYEVVYLLENIDEWLGGSQGAATTRIPFAYLTDIDTMNYCGTGCRYDGNLTRPDSNEPTPASDPFAYIVGLGGTQAFFFNQWLGSENEGQVVDKHSSYGQPGVPNWFDRVTGWDVADLGAGPYYTDKKAHAYQWYNPTDVFWGDNGNMFGGFDGICDTECDLEEINLATDAAKAWTLDGYTRDQYDCDQDKDFDEIIPNKLTGSNIDIQLAESSYVAEQLPNTHFKSILRVMVYAPADGVVQEGSYIWSIQVHKVWQVPVVSTVTVQATDYANAGDEEASAVATVLDQFGNPMPGVTVTFYGSELEGTLDADVLASTGVATDVNGNAAVNGIGAAYVDGDWGVEKITATVGTKYGSDTIQWIKQDGVASGTPNGTSPAGITPIVPADLLDRATQIVMIEDVYEGWNGKTLKVYLNPGANVAGVLGTLPVYVYSPSAGVTFEVNTNLFDWPMDGFYVGANSTDTDGLCNWVHND